MPENNEIGRRGMLKALAGIPVLGLLGIQVVRKLRYEDRNNKKREIIRELGLEDLPSSVKQIKERRET